MNFLKGGFSLVERRTPSAVALLAVTLLFACDECPSRAATATTDTSGQDSGVTRDEESEFITDGEYEILDIGYRVYLSDGYVDTGNRYPFVVMIGAVVGPHETIMCSGTLLNPRVVLTAGHCVCGERKVSLPGSTAHTIIDGSRCATSATIETATYTPAHDGSEMPKEERFRGYEGKVRPHPSLHILLDERAAPISSNADLAVIVLDEPVDGTWPALDLPNSEVKLNEPFMIAGYGFDARTDLILGRRRFGRKKVTKWVGVGSDQIAFEQNGAAFTSGSGEPCLRQEGRNSVLIGITTLISEEGYAFTSTYLHREWLFSELQRAATQQPRTPGTKESTP